MKLAVRIAVVLVILLMVFLSADALRARLAPKRARAVGVGDSREQVRSKLGRPTAVTEAGIFNPSETWAYGGYIDWHHGIAVRFRIFGPDADEVAIRFDSQGKVSKILIPTSDQR